MSSLYDENGHRKYLTPAERDAFIKAGDEPEVCAARSFCATLAYMACRISEALALTVHRVDLRARAVIDYLYLADPMGPEPQLVEHMWK